MALQEGMDELPPSSCPHCLDLDRQDASCQVAELKQGLKQECPRCTEICSIYDHWTAGKHYKIDVAWVSVDNPLPRLRLDLSPTRYGNPITVDTALSFGKIRTPRPLIYSLTYPEDFDYPYAHPERTDSPSSLAQAKRWVDECASMHSHCNSVQRGGFVPTRLVDVVEHKLVDTTRLTSTRPKDYACLSHCWGGRRPRCVTTLENLASQ